MVFANDAARKSNPDNDSFPSAGNGDSGTTIAGNHKSGN